MFKKFFGSKKEEQKPAVEASKGYHTCVDSCEKDIANLESEIELLKKDNTTLMGRVSTAEVANTELRRDLESADDKAKRLAEESEAKDERIAELEKRLEEADEKADGTPVKYASARKTLSKAKLKQLRQSLEAVPDGANGFGGSCSIYDKKTKRVSLVEFKSKSEALAIVEKAEKGNVEIIM